jgi:hypothetical protein
MKEKGLSEAVKEYRNKMKRKWNSEHRDKVKEYQERYWTKRYENEFKDNTVPRS